MKNESKSDSSYSSYSSDSVDTSDSSDSSDSSYSSDSSDSSDSSMSSLPNANLQKQRPIKFQKSRQANRTRSTRKVAEYTLPPNAKMTDFTIVVDYQNVAMAHGKKKCFSCKGIRLCIEYWEKKGFKVVGFVPRYVLKPSRHFQDETKIPDDKEYLSQLADDGHLFECPPQDYDDSYALQFLKHEPSVIVSNDMFRDHYKTNNDLDEKNFIKSHLISYTWVNDLFMPNPDFKWENVIQSTY